RRADSMVPCTTCPRLPPTRELTTCRDLTRPQQDRAGDTFMHPDHVRAEMHTVNEIDVQLSRRPPHHGITCSFAPITMRGRIILATIRLHLRDPQLDTLSSNVRDQPACQ